MSERARESRGEKSANLKSEDMWSLRHHMVCDTKMYTSDVLSRAHVW